MAEICGRAKDPRPRKKLLPSDLSPGTLEETPADDLGVVTVGLSLPPRRSRELLGDDGVEEPEGDVSLEAGTCERKVVLGSCFRADDGTLHTQ